MTLIRVGMRAGAFALLIALVGLAWLLSQGGAVAHEAASGGDAGSRQPASLPSVEGVEDRSLWTARSRTWVKPDGMHVTRVFEERVNVKGSDGRWRPLDLDLARDGARWVNRSNGFEIAIPERLGDGPLRVEKGGRWLTLRLRGSDAAASVDGGVATFPGVASGVTARWTVGARKLKEELLLADAQAPRTYRFDVGLSEGLRLVDQADGSIRALDQDDEVVFVLPAPFAFDAAGELAPKDCVRMHAEAGGSGWVLVLEVSEQWLEAPGRAFPVTVDPTVELDVSLDTYIDESNLSSSYSGLTRMEVGHLGSAPLHDHRGLLRFDIASQLPAEANVMYAKLWAYAGRQHGTTTSPLDVYRVTSSWTNDATWNNRTSADAWTTAGGDVASTPVDSSTAPVEGRWSEWTVGSLVRDWIEGRYANHGFLLRDSGSSTVNAVDFITSNDASPSLWPVLEVHYFKRTGIMRDYTLDTHQLTDRQDLSVNVAGGNLVLRSTDLHIPGRGLDLNVERYHNSGDDWEDGSFGASGRMGFGRDVFLYRCDETDSMCFIGPSGYRARFERNPDGSYESPAAIDATLERRTDGSYRLLFHDTGIRYKFFASQNTFLTDIYDSNGNVIHFDYVSSRLSQIDDTQGRSVDATRNTDGYVTELRDPTGRTWTYGYTGRELTSVRDPDGNQTTYTYGTNGEVSEIVDPRGNHTWIEWDSTGDKVTQVRRELTSVLSGDAVTTYAYSSPGRLCATGDVGQTVLTDPRSETTTYCWNGKGQVTSEHDALGGETERSYTGNNDPDEIVEHADTANPATTDVDYNANNDVTRTVEPEGEQSASTYWSAASNTNDPLRRYRVRSTTDVNGIDEFFDYDDAGNLIAVKDDETTPRNQATLTYNADGTLASFTDGEGHRTTFSYETNGNLRETTPPSVSSPGTLGATTYTYDSLSRVATETDGRGETLTYSYDGLDRMTRVAAEDGSWIAFTYDVNGNLTQRESSGGAVTRYTYDKMNRMTEEDLPGLAFNQYGYDKNGNITSIVDQSGTVTYTYDDVNRVATIVSPRPGGGTDEVRYAYTEPTSTDAFTTKTATLPGDTTQRVERDLSGKVTDVLLKDRSNAVLQQRTYGYLNGSTQTDLVRTLLDQAGNRTTYTYADSTENVGRLLKARTEDRSSTLVTEYRYSIDKNGNRTRREVQTPSGTTTETYAYNAANQLCWRYVGTSANTCAFPPRLATRFTYDAAGNQLTGNNTLTWDPYGRLGSIDGSSTGYLSETNDLLSGFGSTALQDNALGLSRSDDGTTATSIVRDPDTDLPVSQMAGSSKRWYTGDNIGSTIALTDDTGAQARTYAYDPDGVSSTSGSGPDALVRFASGHAVGATGLYHFGARYYDPRIGRWTSRDPVEQYTSLREANRYAYAGGDSVNLTDPSGRCIWKIPCPKPVRWVLRKFYFPCFAYRAVVVRWNRVWALDSWRTIPIYQYRSIPMTCFEYAWVKM